MRLWFTDSEKVAEIARKYGVKISFITSKKLKDAVELLENYCFNVKEYIQCNGKFTD